MVFNYINNILLKEFRILEHFIFKKIEQFIAISNVMLHKRHLTTPISIQSFLFEFSFTNIFEHFSVILKHYEMMVVFWIFFLTPPTRRDHSNPQNEDP